MISGLKTIIYLAQNLNLHVVAKGLETREWRYKILCKKERFSELVFLGENALRGGVT